MLNNQSEEASYDAGCPLSIVDSPEVIVEGVEKERETLPCVTIRYTPNPQFEVRERGRRRGAPTDIQILQRKQNRRRREPYLIIAMSALFRETRSWCLQSSSQN